MEIIEKLITAINKNVSLFAKIGVERLPVSGGISAEPAGGKNTAHYLDGGFLKESSVLILSKNRNQKTALEALFKICDFINQNDIINGIYCEVSSMPDYVDNENGFYIYSVLLKAERYNERSI